MFVLDAHTSECLHYEPVIGVPPTKHVRIPREILEEHPEVEIRNDLIDCMIDVCSLEVRLFILSPHLPASTLAHLTAVIDLWMRPGPLALSRQLRLR